MAVKTRLETFKIDGKDVPLVHEVVIHGAQRIKSHHQDFLGKWVGSKEVPVFKTEYVNTGKKYPYASERQKERQRDIYRLCPLIHAKTCDCGYWKEVKNGKTSLCSTQTR